MQVILTLINLDELPKYHKDYLIEFDAVSLDLDNWTHAFGKRLDAVNTERHAWNWMQYHLLKGGAAELGKRHALKCAKYKIRTFYINAEKDWANSKNPYLDMHKYVQAFRAYAPTYTKLAYNGFSWSRTSDGKKLHDANLIKLFDIWCPMNYGTSRRTIAKWWDRKCFKYANLGPDIYPMVGCGRVASNGDVWGFWGGPDGLRNLLAKGGVDAVCFFFGNGAKNQMLIGHDKHPPLVEVAEEIHFRWG